MCTDHNIGTRVHQCQLWGLFFTLSCHLLLEKGAIQGYTCLARYSLRDGIQLKIVKLFRMLSFIVLCFPDQFLKIQGSGTALFHWCYNREECWSSLLSVDTHPNDGLGFIHSCVESHLPFPSVLSSNAFKKIKTVYCLYLSWGVSWPHPEQPQVWGRKRKFWRKPRPSTWPTPCELAPKLLSLGSVRLIHQLQQQGPLFVPRPSHQPKQRQKVVVKKF